MKKSTILSYLTAATVITTTAGTFAVWDTLTAETQKSTVKVSPRDTAVVDQDIKIQLTAELQE